MTSRLSIFSAGPSRDRRASVAEVIRHATANSSLSRIFTRTKSAPHFNSIQPSNIATGGGTTHATGLEDPNSAANQEFPLLIISPPTAQPPSRDMNIELGALGIIFPQSPTSKDRGPSVTPPGTDTISAWVEFFAQSENEPRRGCPVSEPESVIGTAEGTDGMATPLGLATSSMTLMDPEVCSKASTPKGGEVGMVYIGTFAPDQDLRLIGDEAVLQYILDGMGPFEELHLSLGVQEGPKLDPGHEIGPNVEADPPSAFPLAAPSPQQAGSEPRYRKDPKYEEPPSISLITATPQGTIGERHEYFTISPPTSSPVALLTPYYSRHSLSHATRYQYQPDTRRNFIVLQPGPNTAYVCGSYDSVFLESEFAITRHASLPSLIPTEPTMADGSEPSQSTPPPTNDHPGEHATSPTVFNSFVRKLSIGVHSIFHFGRSAAKGRVRHGDSGASDNRT